MNKVKGMVGLIVESAMPLLTKLESLVANSEEGSIDVRVDEELREVSADVISRACFGSSFAQGRSIFSKLRCLQKLITQQGLLFGLHGFSDLVFGSKKVRKIGELEREVDSLIWETVEQREKGPSEEKDLLQMLLQGACDGEMGNKSSFKRFVVDNCKNIYFAGHETTAVAASWCLLLLALNPIWQIRIRNEFMRFCKDGIPDGESIVHLKTVTMVVQETLRLYPPAAFVSREALADTRLGNLFIPKGVCLWTLISTLHRDPEVWGHDSNEFRPERFRQGVSRACRNHHAYVPFGLGTRLCLGKNLGMVELKVLVSLLVSRFNFNLSPTYIHSPMFQMFVEPKHGVILRITRHRT